ncbi:hypothetical protein ACFQS1_26380 [Paractinoplanes rhizophilus]|jgi:hypothetical protein|uniref:Uncharacterized protein n=1 Tax=Paractinoplanes rhizophilus TaxID=1416877 RepID=A0ABW2HXK3_9ACTN|nr:hypothetical protein [Actinoplanes sp.]
MAAQPYEMMFYEVMWRTWARDVPYPMPWWLQSYFRDWPGDDAGMFPTKQAALASNALYRYWNMAGVKDAHQESLVGQAGEIEPVYERFAVTFFVIVDGRLHLPQLTAAGAPAPALQQHRQDGYLPVVVTTYQPPAGVSVEQRTLSTVVGRQNHVAVLNRLVVRPSRPGGRTGQLGVAVVPVKPSGFTRYGKTGEALQTSQLSFLRYLKAEGRLETNTGAGPVFATAPASFGLYGNDDGVDDADHYLAVSPFVELAAGRALNGSEQARDPRAGLCSAAFLWPFDVTGGQEFTLDLWLPVDDFRDASDFADLTAQPAGTFEAANAAFWRQKLDRSGMQATLPPVVRHLWQQYRSCRADLLILADDGAIHPGPTIYDSFWIRDSSVEAIACSLAGDDGLAGAQLGRHHLEVFQTGTGRIGPASAYGFFGGEHERDAQEWDANGEALWAFGRFDRIQGSAAAFGAKVYWPYVLQGARWIRDNRSADGIMLSGWSAEHIGDRNQPHYWDDLWSLAGLYEAARIAERIGAAEVAELWAAFDSLKAATAASIRWVLTQQSNDGQWETYVPSGPGGDRGLYSTIIGAVAYFHPTRLHYGAKLGDDLDLAFRLTLDTIWAHFVQGGFRHDKSWQAYGPYLTMQLAHAFLLIGDLDRMDALLGWVIGNAAYAKVSRYPGAADEWQVTTGTWNEQHAYPVASDFTEMPFRVWYMGDMPHGWAAAEFMLLLREMLFFEAGEDDARELYIAPGVLPRWLRGDGGHSVTVADAATTYGTPFGYTLNHDEANRILRIDITQAVPGVTYVYPCRLGVVTDAAADGVAVPAAGGDVRLPAGTRRAEIRYR